MWDGQNNNNGSSACEYATLDEQEKQHKNQKPVKRFRTAFILFSTTKHKEFRQKLTKEKEEKKDKRPLKATEVAKLVSESWRSLPPNERAEWDKKAKDDRKRYEDEIKACDDPSMASCSKKDPDAPKRPMSAFLAYSNKKRASLKRKKPYLNNGEMSKFLSKTWKEESEEERQKYIDEARELRLKHKIAVKERNKEVRKQEKENLKRQIKEQKQEAKRGEQTKTRSEEDNGDPQSSKSSRGSGKIKGNPNRKATTPGAPKRPISAFLEYSNGKRASVKRKNPSLSNADISKHLSEQWKAEEPNIRQGFLDAAHDRRVKHKSDMADWHKSMEQRMQDEYQQNRRTESSEYKNSDDITSEDPPTTSETEGIPDTSTGASSSGYASFPTAPSTASVTVATGNHAMFSNHQGTGGPINTANLQYSFPNLSGTNTLGSMQPGGIPALHQPINPFAVAPPSDMPSVAYIPVLTTPGNTILPGYLPGSLPGSIAASTGTPYNSNSASAAAVSYLPTVQGPATQFLPFDSSVGLNAVAAAAGSLNTDRSLFTQQNAAAMAAAQSLAQPAAHLLNLQQNLPMPDPFMGHGYGMDAKDQSLEQPSVQLLNVTGSGPAMGHGDGTEIPHDTVNHQHHMLLIRGNHGQKQSSPQPRAPGGV